MSGFERARKRSFKQRRRRKTLFQRGLKTNQSILLHWNNHRIKEKN